MMTPTRLTLKRGSIAYDQHLYMATWSTDRQGSAPVYQDRQGLHAGENTQV